MEITGAELFVKALKKEEINVVFGYPGGQAIDLFDALYDQNDIEVVLPRHEQGLIHMADGYARSTGKIGVCLVTSGPGATNLVTGIATANYDSVPLVCFTGQVPTNLIGNDAFQEVDIVGITRNICKYAVTVRDRKDLGKTIKKAFYVAKTGKPGVVVVDLPKDIQRALGEHQYPEEIEIRGYNPHYTIDEGQIEEAINALKQAKKPLFLVGGGVNISGAGSRMQQLAEHLGVPVVTTIMGKGALPTTHPLYIGNVGIHAGFAAHAAMSECDVLVAIGTRFSDRITGKIDDFARNATLIHIDIDPAAASRKITADITIVADAKKAVEVLLEKMRRLDSYDWLRQISDLKKAYPLVMKSKGLTPQFIINRINQYFKNAIVVTDVGQNQLWTTQFLELDEKKQMLTSGGLGTMGYGFPAALGAKIGNPKKEVIVITGDGGMQMNIQELATAVVQALPVIICILNNGYLGNVRQWQEIFYKKRYSSTCLCYRKGCEAYCSNPDKDCPKYTPDFIKLAESYGAVGVRVTQADEVDRAFQIARNNLSIPMVIEFIISREENVLPIVPPGSPASEMIMEF